MDLSEIAKQIGIQLTSDAIVDITGYLIKLKKEKPNGKTITDEDKKKAIKVYVSKRPNMLEVAGEIPRVKPKKKKGGGYRKTYAKGSKVRKLKY